jgi:hypothetical protein
MAHRGPRGGSWSHGRPATLRALAAAARRVGTALLGAALPAVVAVLGAALVAGEAADEPIGWIDAALATSVTGGEGLQWAFHVGIVVGAVGLTALAAALLVDGYCRVE